MSATPATSTQTQAPAQAPAPAQSTPAASPATTEDKPAPAVINKKRVHVRRLPFDTNRALLEELASSCGRVTNVEIKRGFGFVTFESVEDAEYAIYKLNGKTWRGAELAADYAKDVPKSAAPVKKGVKTDEKKPKTKREELTLKYLTPPNPATTRVGGAAPKPVVKAPVTTDAATTEAAATAGQTAQAGQTRRGGRGGARGGAGRGAGRGAARGGRGGRGNGRGGRGGNFAANGGQANGSAPAQAAAAPAAAPAQTPAATANHPAPATAAKRGGKKNRGGKAGKGKIYEITVKDVDSGAVTHTLHMTEAEVQQFVQPLTEKVKA